MTRLAILAIFPLVLWCQLPTITWTTCQAGMGVVGGGVWAAGTYSYPSCYNDGTVFHKVQTIRCYAPTSGAVLAVSSGKTGQVYALPMTCGPNWPQAMLTSALPGSAPVIHGPGDWLVFSVVMDGNTEVVSWVVTEK